MENQLKKVINFNLGIKWFILCCSDTRLPLKFLFHDSSLPTEGDLSKISTMVFNMVKDKTHSCVFTDNYFTTHKLFKALQTVEVDIVGTFRMNNVPKLVREKAKAFMKANKKRIAKDEQVVCPYIVVELEGIYYFFILDNSFFVLATNSKYLAFKGNCKTDGMFNKNHRDALNLETKDYKQDKIIPYINHLYNMKMNGVDVLDQYVSSYDRQHRTKSWKQQTYFTSFKIIESISYQMHMYNVTKRATNKLTHLQFKQLIAERLLQRRSNRQRLLSSVISSEITPSYVSLHRRTALAVTKSVCQFQVPNTNVKSMARHPTRNCAARTRFGCSTCVGSMKVGTFLCPTHQVMHQEIEDAK